MVTATDTSFLFSLYGNDSNTPHAAAWCQRAARSIVISQLNRFELINSLRFAEFRQTLKSGEAAALMQLFHQAITAGRLIEATCNLADVLTEATRLSAAHTLSGGHRGFDILHVAAARIMGATHFLTFDANQKRLASAAGLKLPL
ncbi:MAG: type II toxin-antitoxin system VapC family toxin [Verrucomicrobia bacterium]|nr:MAG: type II toxin-antitoxin system VapC family toxin [Verrucomicrobiota bacterium]